MSGYDICPECEGEKTFTNDFDDTERECHVCEGFGEISDEKWQEWDRDIRRMEAYNRAQLSR